MDENIDEKVSQTIKNRLNIFKDIAGQVTIPTIVVFVSWLMGYLNLSILWILMFLVTYFIYACKMDKLRWSHKVGVEYSNNEKEFIDKMIDIPSWVSFPDVERAEWVNKIIIRMWPTVTKYLKNFVESKILPKIQQKLPGIQIKSLYFGDSSPKISGIKMYNDDSMKREEIILDLETYFYSDSEVHGIYKSVNFGIKNLEFKASVRIHATPLVPKIPFVAAFTVSLLRNPHIGYEFTDVGALLNLPYFSSLLRETITDTIAELLVLPNRIPIKLIKDAKLEHLLFPLPEGVIRIQMIEAKNLKAADVELFGKANKSDPYVNIRVGAEKFKTKVIQNNLNPKWNETFEAIIDSTTYQMIEIEVFDKDRNQDDFLGKTDIGSKMVYEKGVVDMWVPLKDVATGTVHVALNWLSLSSDPGSFEMIEMSKEIMLNPLSTAYFYVCVDSAKNLKLVNHGQEPSTYVDISLGNLSRQTCIKKKTQNPVWENTFHFLLQNIYTTSLDVTVKDDKTKKDIGSCRYKIQDLLHASKMEKFETLRLEGGDDNSTIQIYVALRALVANNRRSSTFMSPAFEGSDANHDSDKDSEVFSSNDNNNDIDKTKISVNEEEMDNLSGCDQNIPNPSICSFRGDLSTRIPRLSLSIWHQPHSSTLNCIVSELEGVTSKRAVYLKLHLHPKDHMQNKRKTKSLVSNQTFRFNEKFEFALDSKSMNISMLQLDVKIKRSSLKHNSLLGFVKIDLANVKKNDAVKSWHPIELTLKRSDEDSKSKQSERSV